MNKLKNYFFDDGIALSQVIFYYGVCILGITICIFSLIGMATI